MTNVISPIAPTHDVEQELTRAIEPWLEHMRWRKDFDAWRERRIWQERHQAGNLRDLWQALGGKVAGKRLLDLGAGMGGLSVALMREWGRDGLQVQAMDYNPDYCRIAALRARRYGLRLPILVAAGEQLPYALRLFDIVVCLDVLEHVADVRAVLAEMYRVLRPGGVALATITNRRAFRDPHYHLPLINWLPTPLAEMAIARAGRTKGGRWQDRQTHSELNSMTWVEFKRLAASVGFRVRDQVYHRITRGEIRQLRGWKRQALATLSKLSLVAPIYRLYRYGWQGTFQVILVKPK